ncbi:MAG: hypothetical protein A2X12_03780, partial [Bacteroidetes bacterium GWE2_29_8]
MKQFFAFLLIALISTNILIAQKFTVDGIYYNITSTNTVEVTYDASIYIPTYHGGVVIPSSVIYNSKNYSVTSIGKNAFNSCHLNAVTIPNSVTSIGNSAFYGCSYISSITIPNSVTSIGVSAFQECRGLTSVDIPNSVTLIGYSAFVNCISLISVNIPNSVTSIGYRAFSNCTSLTSINVATDNPNYTSIDGVLYNKDITILKQCPCAKTSITIPHSVTSFESFAFYYCTSLTYVDIPNTVTLIKAYTFYNCTSLTFIEIPNSIQEIKEHAFYNCTSLTSFTCYAKIPPIVGEYVFAGVPKTIPLYVPMSSKELYKEADQWRDFPNIFGLADVGDDKTICKGQETKLYVKDISKDDNYIWSNGMKGSEIIVSPTITTKYYVTGTFNDTLQIVDSVEVNVIDKNATLTKDINISKSRLLYKNTPFELEVDSGYIYEWSEGSRTSNVKGIAVKSSYYYVTVTDTNACNYAMDSVYVKVIDDCSVNGTVYFDCNENQQFDYFEKGLKNIKIKINPNGYAITDNYGKFISNPYKTNSEVSLDLGENSIWELSTSQASFNLNFSDTGNSNNVMFGLKAKEKFSDLSVYIYTNRNVFHTGREEELAIYVQNKGTVMGSGYLTISYDTNFIKYLRCDKCKNITEGPGSVTFFIDTINVFESKTFIMPFYVKTNNIGKNTVLQACMQDLYFMKNMVTKNNCDTLIGRIVGAVDPNDKNARWTQMINKKYVGFDKEIEYMVRFQNTGNDTAWTVIIADSLDKNIDKSTLELIASSHDVVTSIDSNGVVLFKHFDIMLPDSNVDSKGSNGYVIYTVKLYDTIRECTEIKNKAGIFFDFNDPVITNEVVSTYSTIRAGISSDITINEGDSAIITATGGTNYLWSNSETEQSITIKPLSNTTYTVTVSDQYGCFETAEAIVGVKTSIGKQFIIDNGELT